MIDYETYCRIKQYQQEGLKAGQIAQNLDLDPRTVESWLDEPQYRQRNLGETSSKLDPYKEDIVSLLEKHPYTATQIYQRLQEEGSIEVGTTRRKLNFFVMVLCHSRMMYVEFSLAQSMEHFLACHQHAFEFFGGIPENIMIDNLKTGVL